MVQGWGQAQQARGFSVNVVQGWGQAQPGSGGPRDPAGRGGGFGIRSCAQRSMSLLRKTYCATLNGPIFSQSFSIRSMMVGPVARSRGFMSSVLRTRFSSWCGIACYIGNCPQGHRQHCGRSRALRWLELVAPSVLGISVVDLHSRHKVSLSLTRLRQMQARSSIQVRVSRG